MRTIEIERAVRCVSPPEAMWALLSDTGRVNRAAGMDRLLVAQSEGDNGARVLVRTRLDGLPVTYEEEPFEWRVPEHFRVRRNMKSGALQSLQMGLDVTPTDDGGSLVRWRLVFTVKVGLIAPITRFLGERRMTAIVAATQAFDAEVRAPAAPPAEPKALPEAGRVLVGLLTKEEAELGARLVAWVASAPDVELVRIRPFELADRWGADRDATLAVCLEAVVAGLLEMHWDLVCPSCQTGASRVDHLFELGEGGHCSYCDIGFELPLDRAVEAVFRPTPAVRTVEVGPFCTGGPAASPHVLAQAHLPADGEATLLAPGTPGPYRVFVRGGAVAALTVAAGGGTEAVFVARGAMEPAEARVAPGATLRIRQPGGTSRHVKLERTEWSQRAATAHHLSLHPRFRRLFSGEVLAPGRQLRVARVALLFSDLSASTALYSRVGDASAFRLVQDHFDLLREKIAASHGVVVKTIGDAVMAAFPDEASALAAAVAMQSAWPEFQAPRPDGAETLLKLGVHAGPAYVVTANGVLDYFGQTVNLAARLQGAAHEREIVVTEELAARAESGGWLLGARVVERFDAVLKGLERPIPAVRLVVG